MSGRGFPTPGGDDRSAAELARARSYASPADPASEPAVMFPLGWYEDFLRAVTQRGIEVITYRDLFAHSEDRDHEHHFPDEFRQWKKRRDPSRTYLLIQHDVDHLPAFTERMVAMEAAYGIRSNIFLFVERSTRRGPGPYPIDHAFFETAEAAGFVIGYHQNALQLAGFDVERAVARYRRDVETLSRHYHIEFVVPHGGAGGVIDGVVRHNHDVPVPPELTQRLRWVYNRYGVTFTRRWSDGGLRKSRDPERIGKSDLIGAFLDELQPGTRNFCLVHPQRWGFHLEPTGNPMLASQPWYRAMCGRYDVAIASPPTS